MPAVGHEMIFQTGFDTPAIEMTLMNSVGMLKRSSSPCSWPCRLPFGKIWARDDVDSKLYRNLTGCFVAIVLPKAMKRHQTHPKTPKLI